MNTGVLISDPTLDDELEEARVTRAVLRIIGDNLSVDDARFGKSIFQQLEAILTADPAAEIPDGLLPTLNSMFPGDPQYAITVELSRLPTQMIYRLNRVPNHLRVAFLALLNTRIIPATFATTTITFKKLNAWLGLDVTIPAGTIIADRTGQIRVTTDVALTIPAGTLTDSVAATSLIGGNIGRIPVGVIGFLQSAIAGIIEISNTTALDGGRDAEALGQAIIRARESMRIGDRWVAADDFVVKIFYEALGGLGRVTPFEFYAGNLVLAGAGYLTLVVQSADGLAPTDQMMQTIAGMIAAKRIASIYVMPVPASYVQFGLDVQVKLGPQIDQSSISVLAQAKQNLVNRFAPLTFKFGTSFGQRYISLSDITFAIESAGPDQISVDVQGNALPITIILPSGERVQRDVPLGIGELPYLTIDQITLRGPDGRNL